MTENIPPNSRGAAEVIQAEEMKPFEREERYLVVKRKHLMPDGERIIRRAAAEYGAGLVECVVVEIDWPEYETVWKMIEDRLNHRTDPSPAYQASDAELIAAIAEDVARELDEGSGFWRICSGCSGTDNPRSQMFRCEVGMGCRECGGLGVIWDDTDYAAMAEESLADEAPTNTQAQAPLSTEQGDGWAEAVALAKALHEKHYAHVAQWRPLDTVAGVISQIDNMTATLVSPHGTGERP